MNKNSQWMREKCNKEKEFHQTSSAIPCANYTCKECEDEINRKGHFTKPQDVVDVENVKNDF